MPRRNHKHSRKGGHVSCPGYTDEFNIWNNGFYCPRWGGPDQRYCCQNEQRHFCCPEPTPEGGTEAGERSADEKTADEKTGKRILPSVSWTTVLVSTNAVAVIPTQTADQADTSLAQYIPIIASVCAVIFLVFLCSVIGCFICRCCPLHRSRKNNKSKAADDRSGAPAPCAACSEQYGSTAAPPSEPVDRLHCGCRSCGTPASSLHCQPFLPSLGSLGSSWQTDLDKLSEPADLPPGYTEGQLASLHGSRSGLQPSRSGLLSRPALQGSRAGLQGSRAGLQGPGQQDSPTGLQANRWSPTDVGTLCMTTFRPLSSPRSTATVLPTLVTPPVPPGGELWRRDSGVLVEESESDNWSRAAHVSPLADKLTSKSYDIEDGVAPPYSGVLS